METTSRLILISETNDGHIIAQNRPYLADIPSKVYRRQFLINGRGLVEGLEGKGLGVVMEVKRNGQASVGPVPVTGKDLAPMLTDLQEPPVV